MRQMLLIVGVVACFGQVVAEFISSHITLLTII